MRPLRPWILVCSLVLAGCGSCGGNNEGVDLPAIDAGDAGTTDMTVSPEVEREAILAVPETATLTIPALENPVHVVRTAGDVPHIYAQSERDLYVAAGYVFARDRYFLLYVGSLLARGELATLLGRFGIASDVDARTRGITFVADRILESMDEEVGALYDAYADGVNAYVDAARAGDLPPPSEFDLAAPLVGESEGAALLEYLDRQSLVALNAFIVWEAVYTEYDIQRQIAWDDLEGRFLADPLRRAAMVEMFEDTAPRYNVSTAPGWGLNGELGAPNALLPTTRTLAGVGRDLPALPEGMRERLRQGGRLWRPFGPALESDRGSNGWAVSSDQTADGSVFLAGDGHLALTVPGYFFQMGFDTRTFGDESLRVGGLFLPGFPFLGVGTNGEVAWTQTFPRADVQDWYREELRLDVDGMPDASLFGGEWRPLQRFDEEYFVAGILGDDPKDVVYPRWTTFDGRRLVEIEGRFVEDPEAEVLADGESLVNMAGNWVVPGDEDGDGVVTGVTIDFMAFDMVNLAKSVKGLQESRDVEEFQSQMRNFVGYAQNLITADRQGNVGFATYTATPCRGYLPRDADGNWVEGANPQLLLDGTTYGGFEAPLNEAGELDPELAGDDPYRCVYSFEQFPRVLKDNGWVVNANEDPAGASFDGSLQNDAFYIGGPWVPGYRADTIDRRLEAGAGRHDTESMVAIQADHESALSDDFAPELLRSVEAAQALLGRPDAELSAAEIRLRDLYDANSEAIDEATDRIRAWLDRGANAASGVATFYNSPTAEDREDAVATMIFNAWLRYWILEVFEDEDFRQFLEQPSRARMSMIRALRSLTEGRGPDNPLEMAGWNPDTEESVFFDDLTTVGVTETSEECAVGGLVSAFEWLSSEPLARGNGGFGTMAMDQWIWGLRHRVVLDSILGAFASGNPAVNVIAKEFLIDTLVLPLADDIPEGDPRKGMRWFPRPGDSLGVDAGNRSYFGDENFDYADGPVMRMVIKLGPDGEVSGQNVIPGGQSGITGSPHFADQAALWLGNEALPFLFDPLSVAEGATGREVLSP